MIDIEKFICSLLADHPVGVTVREDIHKALKDQGLEYKGGKIVPIEDKTALKESEDERIRKWLIALIRNNEYGSISDVGVMPCPKPRVLAWLEEQGKQDMIPLDKAIKFLDNQLVDDKDEVTGEPFINFQNYGAFKETFISFFKRKMLEEQGEQKPTKNVEPKFEVGDTMRTLQEAANGYTDGMPVVISVDKEYYHCTNELIAIKDQDNYEFPPINVKQKPTEFKIKKGN